VPRLWYAAPPSPPPCQYLELGPVLAESEHNRALKPDVVHKYFVGKGAAPPPAPTVERPRLCTQQYRLCLAVLFVLLLCCASLSSSPTPSDILRGLEYLQFQGIVHRWVSVECTPRSSLPPCCALPGNPRTRERPCCLP
jgi:hypothetical protein